MHPELGLAFKGFLALGDLGTVTHPSIGGDASLQLARHGGGLGLRAAAGLQLLQTHKIPTGEVIFNGTGTQPGEFVATQSIWWAAIGPTWLFPMGESRVVAYLMGGRAIARATSGLGWMNTAGSEPGSTNVSFALAGASWSPPGPVELGAELFAGGRAAFWDNPPVVVDDAGNHVLQVRTASITGLVIRLGYRFGAEPD